MKIGIFILSPNWSGAEKAILNICENICLNDKTISMFVNRDIIKNYKSLKNIQIVDLGGFYNRGRLNKYISYLRAIRFFKHLYKESFDLFMLLLEGSFLIFSSSYKKFPVIVNLRGEEIDNLQNNRGNFLLNYYLEKALRNSSKIIAVAKHQIKKLPEKYKKKTVVIPNGVDSKLFKPLKNIKQKRDVILFVGRYKWEKGIREIINVAKQLPQYEFWFAGQGPLANLINLSNTKNLGFKNQNELIRLYNQATICILPSYREGFSNVGLEVTACGRALICTPPFSEYIENGKEGIIIPAKDEKALKEAIVKLMTNKTLRKKIEKNARKKALRYSWDKVAKQYLKVFKELINK